MLLRNNLEDWQRLITKRVNLMEKVSRASSLTSYNHINFSAKFFLLWRELSLTKTIMQFNLSERISKSPFNNHPIISITSRIKEETHSHPKTCSRCPLTKTGPKNNWRAIRPLFITTKFIKKQHPPSSSLSSHPKSLPALQQPSEGAVLALMLCNLCIKSSKSMLQDQALWGRKPPPIRN